MRHDDALRTPGRTRRVHQHALIVWAEFDLLLDGGRIRNLLFELARRALPFGLAPSCAVFSDVRGDRPYGILAQETSWRS